MARTAFTAPAHIVQQKNASGNILQQPDSAPSMVYGGSCLLDPRLPYNKFNATGQTGTIAGAAIIGWAGSFPCTVDQVPSAIATANIAALANVTSGTAMTLVSTTGAGATVVATGGFLALPSLNTVPAGAIAIDGLPGYHRLGLRDITAMYDATTGIARCVSITGVSSGTGGNFLISGYDWYGYPMSQLLTVGAGVNTVNTTKAFKFVTSVVPQFTDAHNYSVGTADIFGFNLAADRHAFTRIFWVDVGQLVAQFTAAVTTSPATTTTGDVRGTFTAGSASDGTKRLQIFISPSASRLAQSPITTGLFGVPQV